ncbi:MAG TPA: PfkB family carbohydrate kinase [Acidimicrobiales bacterium]
MAPSRLFCADTVLIDVVLTLDALPPRAGDVRANSQLIATGGGFNAMSAAARHDAPVVYAGRLGTGPFATLARADLAREGIAVPIEVNAEVDTGVCIVLIEPDAERTFITTSGAEGTLRETDLEKLDVGGGDYLLVSGYNVMYDDMARSVIGWIESVPADAVVAFDPASRVGDIPSEHLERVLRRTDWLLCNAAEATSLSGVEDALAATAILTERHGAINVLVRRGADGCVVGSHGTDAVSVPGFAATPLDTNGAGDVHNGVFLAELARGAAPLCAARWANAAAAMAVGVAGPATGPRRYEVEAFIAECEGPAS